MKLLKLNEIVIDAGTQIRVAIDQKTVQEYTEMVMEGVDLPPVDVFFDGVKYYLADGFHRYLAHTRAVKPEIKVVVHNGTVRDALLFAAGANSKHGLKRTPQDKRNAVQVLLNDFEFSMMSDREIAKACGVSNTFVSNLRKELEEPPKKEKPNEVVDAPKDRESKSVKTEVKEEENDEEQEYLIVNQELASENEELKQRLAVKAMDATPEEKEMAEQTMAEMRERIKQLEIENSSLKSSRDSYQHKVAELTKQVTYWKRQAEKAKK